MALGDINLHFVWILVTSTCTLCCRGHLWHGAGTGGALGSWWRWSSFCGRHGAWRHRPSLGVAGVALGDIDSATLRMLPRPAVAIHLYPWFFGTSVMATKHDHPPLIHNTCTYNTLYTQYVLTPHIYTHTHTSVPHDSFPHNSLTHTFPGNTCTHNTFTPAPVPHRSFTHRTFTHDSFTHTHHFYTPHLYTHFFHQQHLYTELFHTPHLDMHFLHTPILHHLFSLPCLSHPIFTFLCLLIGRSWHVGLAGPLILQYVLTAYDSMQI